jgi:hypothetical protein
LARIFIEAGFGRVNCEESDYHHLFRAEKVPGFDRPLAQTGRA